MDEHRAFTSMMKSGGQRSEATREGFRQTAIDLTLNVCDRMLERVSEESGVARTVRFASKVLRRSCSADILRHYEDEPWMKEIRSCQDEIARSGVHPHYTESYRGHEISFWLHIPRWIYEDRTSKGIKRCLDIGCAYGTLALFCKRVTGCEIYCLDAVDTYLTKSIAEKHNVIFAVSNIELDPFPWNVKFNAVILTEVLEHFNFNPLPTLRKIRDQMTDDGRLYLSTPDASQWGRVRKGYSSWKEIPHPDRVLPPVGGHAYQFNEEELLDVADMAGFRVERLDYSPGFGARHFNLVLVKK